MARQTLGRRSRIMRVLFDLSPLALALSDRGKERRGGQRMEGEERRRGQDRTGYEGGRRREERTGEEEEQRE